MSVRQGVVEASLRSVAYGIYYTVLFSLRTPGEHSAALTLLWAKETEKWKIIAYELLAP
jgi:hypothetical protein